MNLFQFKRATIFMDSITKKGSKICILFGKSDNLVIIKRSAYSTLLSIAH